MIPWQGFIAKLIDLMTDKLLGKQFDLALDEKKRACKVFVKLYFAMEHLEELTLELLMYMEPVVEGKETTLTSYFLPELSARLDANSQSFFEAVEHLGDVLELFDPDLAAALGSLSYSKFSFLMIASESFQIEREPNYHIEKVKFNRPDERLVTINLEEHYEWMRKNRNSIEPGVDYEWPHNVLINFFTKDEIVDGEIRLKDTQTVTDFYRILMPHANALSRARERLRKLIIDKFSIEDVLYVSKGIN